MSIRASARTGLPLTACLLLMMMPTIPALAGVPHMRLGVRAVGDFRWDGSTFYDSLGNEDLSFAFHKPGVGPDIYAEYRPWSFVGLRLTLAQLRFNFEGGGDGIRFLPSLGLDAVVLPPVDWRVRPYAWFGATAASFWTPGMSLYPPDPDWAVWAGPGVEWRFSSALTANLELQVWSSQQYSLVIPGYSSYRDRFDVVAIEKASLGLSYSLPD